MALKHSMWPMQRVERPASSSARLSHSISPFFQYLRPPKSLRNTGNILNISEKQEIFHDFNSVFTERRTNTSEFVPFNQEDDWQDYVTRIPVTRQKYIDVCKLALIDAITDSLKTNEHVKSEFTTVCTCLESILHAEHKQLLEQLRVDRHSSLSTRSNNTLENQNENGSASVSNAPDRTARFQQNIMQALRRAQFQELSARDLQLATALNSDYLLTVPIDVDWKTTSSANVIIFRRGYATEKQEGFLFGAKLDYIQSVIFKKIINVLAKPLLMKVQAQEWTEPLRKWLEEPLGSDEPLEESPDDKPVWAAAQRAVPRYEAVFSSAGSRGKLLRRLLVWMRILPPLKNNVSNLFSDTSPTKEPYLRPSYLTRVSIRDIWFPASLESQGSLWRKLRGALTVFFTRSKLQEPAFKELVVMHGRAVNGADDTAGDQNLKLELNTYNNIPVPDLKVVFPNKKLNFRLLDTVRLDLTTIAGLLAFLVNYRFDDFLSSPSAFVLDIVATVSLIVFATRVALGYKQTWDRYQLLVNTTLYEKTLASGFGVVHFLIDASEEQQLKQAILMYGLLLHSSNNQDICLDELASSCERFFYDKFKLQIQMPVKEAEETLSRLGLVTLQPQDSGSPFIRALPFSEAIHSLETKWHTLLKPNKNRYT